MKTKPVKKSIKVFFMASALILISACRPTAERTYNEALVEIEKGHFRIATDLLEKSANAEKKENEKFKYLLEAARIARFEIQDFDRAIRFYRAIILGAQDENRRIKAQEAITEIYLENIQSYNLALRELQILEPLVKEEKEKEKIKLKIAQTQYLTGNYQPALDEINMALKTSKTETMDFLKLKAQIFVAQKKYKEGIDIYQEILKQDSAYFEKENLFIAASVVYEENEDFSAALDYLIKYENQIKDKAYYELRSKRLKERLVNKPFYKGRRK
ncbi:MAG: CDC27 family protein [Bdellovibrionota bacterium]